MAFERLRDAIDELVQSDTAVFCQRDAMVELESLAARMGGLVALAADAFDQGNAWSADGAKSAATWLAMETRLPRADIKAQVRLGRSLRQMPAVKKSLLAGTIAPVHAELLAQRARRVTSGCFERDEQTLVEVAEGSSFATFTQALSYWEQRADPDGAEEGAQRRADRRDVYLEESFGEMYLGRMTLDPISGAIVKGELDRLGQDLFEADWSAAKEALGRDPNIDELPRTPAQRRADALVEMAARSNTAPAGGRRPAPLFSVLVGYETLSGRILELAQGSALTPGSLLRWLEEADIERAVFTPANRIECSETQRLFSGATRRALELRDRQCRHDHCEERAERCQADHIIPFIEDGPTTQENGQMLCGFHNRLWAARPPPGEPF